MTAPPFDLATTVRRPPASAALQAADRAVAAALESARADSTNRVYRTQWRSFSSWCSDVGLRPLPADPLTVARYLGVRGEAGVSMATLRQAASAITRVHEWIGQPSPFQDPGVRESLKGWARRLARPQRQAGALTSDVLGVLRLTAGKPRPLGRGTETLPQAATRARFDVALVAALTWGNVERWADGSGRITVVSSKTDVVAQGAVVAITPTAMKALDAIRPAGVAREEKVFRLSASQIARRVKALAKAAGLPDWESFSGHSGRVGMARRMAQNSAPTHEIERQGRWKQGGGMVGRYTRRESAGSALRYL